MYRSSTVNMTSISFDQKIDKGPTRYNGTYFIYMRPIYSILPSKKNEKNSMNHATMMTAMTSMVMKTGTTMAQTMTFK